MARVLSPVGLGPEDPTQVDLFLLSDSVSALVLFLFIFLLFYDVLDEKNRARASTPLGSVFLSCLYTLPTCCSPLLLRLCGTSELGMSSGVPRAGGVGLPRHLPESAVDTSFGGGIFAYLLERALDFWL